MAYLVRFLDANENPTVNFQTTLRTAVTPGSGNVNGDTVWRTTYVLPPTTSGTSTYLIQPAPLGDLTLPPF